MQFVGQVFKKKKKVGKNPQPCAENALADGAYLFQTPGPSLLSIFLFLVLDPFTAGETNAKNFPIAPLRISNEEWKNEMKRILDYCRKLLDQDIRPVLPKG